METEVKLGREYAKKFVKNRRTKFEGFSEIQNTIDRGICMQLDRHHLGFLWVKDRVKPEVYFLLIKTNGKRDELWIVTFYRLKKKQYTKKLDPYAVIRQHYDDDDDSMG